ncbi:MAG: ribonuclease HII [Candidatus Bathyarchaeia archaeon]
MKILGVDEAGRGPVIGPMVICGVLFDEASVPALVWLGVKDSKQLIPERRLQLREAILALAEAYHLVELSPQEIDGAVRLRMLNQLEAKKIAEIIDSLKPDIAYVDAPSTNPRGFLRLLRRFLTANTRIVAENHADEIYPVVGAASILAKTRRDEIVQGYCKAYGEVGSGYPSDEVTVAFLESYYRLHRSFPEFVRLEWQTRKDVLCRIMQRRLDHFAESRMGEGG